jgi:peptide/nickel transport system substrate-binding protein
MYRPLEFYEFNTSTWTNFPTEENPYAPPMWGNAGIAWIFKLKKAGS